MNRRAMPDEERFYLSAIQILRDLTPAEMRRLSGQLTRATCKPGVTFFSPDDAGDVLFLIEKGQAQLYRLSSTGEKSAIITLGPGAAFGEMPLIEQTMHQAFAEAVGECTLCVMSRSHLQRLLKEKPLVARRVVEASSVRR